MSTSVGAVVHAPQVARVAAVAAAERARGAFDDDDARAALGGGERRAQRGIAAAEDGDVIRLAQAQRLNARTERVLHADDAGNATDDVLGLPALDLGVDDARQKHAGVADDDVDRRNGLRGVVGERRVAIERVRDDAAEPVVAERGGQHLEVVDEILGAVDVRGAPREILGLDRLRDITRSA